MGRLLLLLFFIPMIQYSCAESPNFDIVPSIEYLRMSKSEMIQGNFFTDSIIIEVAFKDGDGDLGLNDPIRGPNVFLIDSRTNQIYSSYRIPEIPDVGANNGVEGVMYLKVYNSCCIFSSGIPPCEIAPSEPINELIFEIYLIDDAGNQSNTVETDVIRLLCQ